MSAPRRIIATTPKGATYSFWCPPVGAKYRAFMRSFLMSSPVVDVSALPIDARARAIADLPNACFPWAGEGIKKLVFVVLFLLLSIPGLAQTLTGPARVIDGDTLELQGQRIRLHGVDAPELRQTCFRPGYGAAGKVSDSSPWACGVAARRHLEELIRHRPVTCHATDKDRYGRVIARCFVGQPHIDLGGWMVRQGLAIAYTKYSTDYLPQESVARGARAGIWAGTFVQPEQWRKGVR